MKKVAGIFTGAVIGAFVGLFFCDAGVLMFFIIIGAIIGLFVGIFIDKEESQQQQMSALEYQHRLEREEAERKAKQEEKYQRDMLEEAKELLYNIAISHYEDGEFKIWKSFVNDKTNETMYYTACIFKRGYETIYDKVWRIKSEIAYYGSKYSYDIDDSIKRHIQSLNNDMEEYLKNLINGKNIIYESLSLEYYIIHKLKLLKYANKNDCNYDKAIHTMENFLELLKKPMYFLESNEYGNFTLPLDNPEEMKYMDENALKIEEQLEHMLDTMLDNSDGYYCGISKGLTEEFLRLSGKLMWYYAKKQPFNVNKFGKACIIYGKYTIRRIKLYGHDYYSEPETAKLEELLSKIYNRIIIGGSALAQQEKENIDNWLKDYNHNNEDVEILASALAWMELYDLELDVLRYMVRNSIQMKPEVQERLRFLESGGASSNVKVYEVEPKKDFLYDSSSENWNATEFDMFFRKAGMKKITLNYSLSISTWKKTLPLSRGQKVSMNDIYQEFECMTKDFDGEVICRRTKAKAINLDNVSYPDAVVFQFKSERNKCLSMLFLCNMFGKNFNLEIITLFTPESETDIESLQKYATAIKSNIYVDSFRETILQAIDEVIKEKRDIYDDESSSSSGKKFVE